MTQTSGETLNPDEAPAAAPAEPSLIEETRFPNVKPSTLRTADNTPTFIVPASEIVEVCQYLKETGFTLFEDVTAVDWLPKEPRFQVVYHFMNITARKTIRLKVELPGEKPSVPSITGVFIGANWFEREVFDLFGIVFENHPDLRRIEMPDDWEGHPLRKDYPITGPRRPNLPANQFRPEGRTGPTLPPAQ